MNPDLLPDRTKRDAMLKEQIQRAWNENLKVYESYEGIADLLTERALKWLRCTVERLMKDMGSKSVVRGRKIRTTIPDESANRPADLVGKNFTALRPNQLWVADLTYVAVRSG